MADSSKQKIEITFKSSGACPPVYVSGAFTSPPWQVCEMKYHPMIKPGAEEDISAEIQEYLFYRQFQISEGHWQYKFRLGPGDWWVCDENAEVVTDGVGNRNNLLVVTPSHIGHACVNKRVHAKPLACSKDSSQDSAWESMELDLPSHTEHKEPFPEDLQRHCHIEGHFNPNCAREEYIVADDNSAKPIHESVSVADRVYTPHQRPQLLDSNGNHEFFETSKLTIPSLSIQEEIGHSEESENSPDKEAFDDCKISNVNIKKVKLLMSIPSLSSPSTAILAVHDGDILELDGDCGVSRASPSLIGRTSSHAPLLSHECLTCENPGDVHEDHAQDIHPSSRHHDSFNSDSEQEALTTVDINKTDNPNIELFPSGARNILQRMATLHKELPPDETVSLDYESPFDSPARFTKDAPTFAHELPPIGSPADARRKFSSYDSPDFAILTDGSSDTHPWNDSRPIVDAFRLPPSHSFEEENVDEQSRMGSLNRSFAEIKELDAEEQPLMGTQRASERKPATYETISQPSSASEGARLRSARTAELFSSTEDSSSGSDDKEHVTRTVWQRVLYWFSVMWTAAFGRQQSSNGAGRG